MGVVRHDYYTQTQKRKLNDNKEPINNVIKVFYFAPDFHSLELKIIRLVGVSVCIAVWLNQCETLNRFT